MFIGDTDSGKCLPLIRLTESIDPVFSIDRIVFAVNGFLSIVNTEIPAGR